MQLTRSYRVLASGRMILNFPWEPWGDVWICNIDRNQGELLNFVLPVPMVGTAKIDFKNDPNLKKLAGMLGASAGNVGVFRHEDHTELMVDEHQNPLYKPPTSIDITSLYNEKVQQAADEMGVDWEPGQEIPGELMWYMHG